MTSHIHRSHYDFDHIVCDRGYFDKEDFIRNRSATVDTPDEELHKYSVIDSSQLYFTDHHEHQFTLPPDPIQWLNNHIFKPGYLASIQEAKLKELKESPERLAELEADLKTLSDEIGTDYELHLKPDLFPEELWKFVRKRQRPLIKERFARYTTPNILEELVSDLLNKLKVKNNGSNTDKYLRAQALANLHAYRYIDPDHPPCVPGYKIPLKLTDNTPVHSKPRKISQIESAFLHWIHAQLTNVPLQSV